MGKEVDDDDERREAAIASTLSLQPNFKPKGVTQDQLSKFQDLHRRRLEMKSSSKIKKKTKERMAKPHNKFLKTKDSVSEVEDLSVSNSGSPNDKKDTPLHQDRSETSLSSKRCQKLHWGLDTKERWERKANM